MLPFSGKRRGVHNRRSLMFNINKINEIFIVISACIFGCRGLVRAPQMGFIQVHLLFQCIESQYNLTKIPLPAP
jgi:hypothetical protein